MSNIRDTRIRLREKYNAKHGIDKPPNVLLYILCHSDERYQQASHIYKDYYWARPLRMKYQDCTFENAAWKQLLEIHDEWKDYEMVGSLSFAAYRKINLARVDAIIRNRQYWGAGYVHFRLSNNPPETVQQFHPHVFTIMKDVSQKLGVSLTTEAYCNYWMCRPDLMVEFIHWFETTLKPAVLDHPLALQDANYKEKTLTSEECIRLYGGPHYPNAPFVFERMNKIFFVRKLIP